jgi:uncharacterized protein (DUF1501 family)
MSRPHLSRRFVLLGGGLALGGALAGLRQIRQVVAATPDDELRFIHVYLNGGWDVLLGPDPRDPAGTYSGIDLGTTRLAAEFQQPTQVTLGGQTALVGPTMTGMSEHFDKLTIFRGVNMNTVAHATGRAYVNSFLAPAGTVVRGSSMATAASSLGPLARERILPNVAVGFPSYNDRYSGELTAVSMRRAADINGLLRPLTTPLAASEEALLAAAQDQAESCVSPRYPGPRPAEQLASSRARLRRLMAENLSAQFDFGGTSPDMVALRARFGFPADAITRDGSNVGLTAALAAQLVRLGVSRSVTISMAPSLDTHGPEWVTDQPTRQRAALNAVGALLTDLREIDPNFEKTMVIVTSEFARTPKFNGRGGRDHWFANSVLVFGSALRPGVFGSTGPDNLSLQGVDLATGAPMEGGQVLLPEHLGATIVSALGGDHSPFRVSPINSLIPGRS